MVMTRHIDSECQLVSVYSGRPGLGFSGVGADGSGTARVTEQTGGRIGTRRLIPRAGGGGVDISGTSLPTVLVMALRNEDMTHSTLRRAN